MKKFIKFGGGLTIALLSAALAALLLSRDEDEDEDCWADDESDYNYNLDTRQD